MRIVVPHLRRWRALGVFNVGDYVDNEDRWTVGDLIFKTNPRLEFPALKRVIIPGCNGYVHPNFLSPTRMPSLEHLELVECAKWEKISSPSTLKTLKLSFGDFNRHHPLFPRLIRTQMLTTLSLEGCIDGNTNELMQAIVTPNLERFDYDPHHEENCLPSASAVFGGLGRKFSSVRHISFLHLTMVRHYLTEHDPNALPLCEAFPNVCHAELTPEDLAGLFMARPCNAESTQYFYPIDVWKDLQSLTFRGSSDMWMTELEQLPGWLMQ
ncbi:hypothetical protein J3A83DRAFT_4372008 [Scleroderma citrinum]